MNTPELPCEIQCPECPMTMWCSEEDPDAGMDRMYQHLYWDHALGQGEHPADAQSLAHSLLAKITVVAT